MTQPVLPFLAEPFEATPSAQLDLLLFRGLRPVQPRLLHQCTCGGASNSYCPIFKIRRQVNFSELAVDLLRDLLVGELPRQTLKPFWVK